MSDVLTTTTNPVVTVVTKKTSPNSSWALEPSLQVTRTEVSDSSAQLPLTNWQHQQFADLITAIERMSTAQSHELHLDPVTASRAAQLVALIRSNTTALPPKIINEGGERLHLTWLSGGIKTYLSVDQLCTSADIRSLREADLYTIGEWDVEIPDVQALSAVIGAQIRTGTTL